MPITAVTFDFWNTIAREPPGTMHQARHAAVSAAAASQDVELEAERLTEVLAEIARHQAASWEAGTHFAPREGAARLVETLGLEGAAEELVAEAFLGAGCEAEINLAPEIEPTLERLAEAGIALGIVCDTGFTGGAILREHLDRKGLLRHFGGWAFSDEVGAYKPDPRIFGAALAALDAEPTAALHIGDLRRTDIAGARGVGMHSVRYTGVADDPLPGEEADHVLADHRELPELVARIGR